MPIIKEGNLIPIYHNGSLIPVDPTQQSIPLDFNTNTNLIPFDKFNFIKFGEAIHITTNSDGDINCANTSDCQYCGCRTLFAGEGDRKKAYTDHGGSFPQIWYIYSASGKNNGSIIEFGDPVHITINGTGSIKCPDTSNCGLCGCQTLFPGKNKGDDAYTYHGENDPPVWYIYSANNPPSRGIQYGNPVHITAKNVGDLKCNYTSNCGRCGCKTLFAGKKKGDGAYIYHGGNDPETWFIYKV